MMNTAWTLSTRTRHARLVSFALGAIVLALAVMPLFLPRGAVQSAFQILTLLVLAQCWNLLAGYAGLISVGQQAFVGMGAYAFFVLAGMFGIPPLLAIVMGGVAAASLAVPAAAFTFRLQGAYFAIGTWVVAEIVRLVLGQQSVLGGGSGMALPRDLGQQLPGVDWLIAAGFRRPAAVDVIAYWMALLLMLATVLVIYRFMRTRSGLGLAAMRDNQVAAESVGVDAPRLKYLVYVGVAFVTGICGSLIFLQKQRVSPETAFSVTEWSAFVIFVVVIGGIGTIEGPIIGVLVFFILQHALADFGPVYMLILGLLGVVTMLLAPTGLWGLIVQRTGLDLFPVRQKLLQVEPSKNADRIPIKVESPK